MGYVSRMEVADAHHNLPKEIPNLAFLEAPSPLIHPILQCPSRAELLHQKVLVVALVYLKELDNMGVVDLFQHLNFIQKKGGKFVVCLLVNYFDCKSS